jgi:hypothetical protein
MSLLGQSPFECDAGDERSTASGHVLWSRSYQCDQQSGERAGELGSGLTALAPAEPPQRIGPHRLQRLFQGLQV